MTHVTCRLTPKNHVCVRVCACVVYLLILCSTGPSGVDQQVPVVVETVTKSSTVQRFAAAQPLHDVDASRVTTAGAGLQAAQRNHDATFSVDASRAGNCPSIYV